jgi:hypothetical protein
MQSVHPGWCDPRYCRVTDIDVQHRSTPTLLTTYDHEWWFTLARADGWAAHPEAHGDTELLIDVHNTTLSLPDVQHVLRVDEIESYANRLLIECHRAQFLGASVRCDVPRQVPDEPRHLKPVGPTSSGIRPVALRRQRFC